MINKRKQLDIVSMTQMAFCVAILCISSYLVIPLPFTPIVLSMHTIIVNLIGLLLKPKYAVYTILMYLFMGIIGLPVFSGGTSGLGKLFGPTGGFYFGFVFAVLAISLLKGKKTNFWRYVCLIVGIGIPIQHFFAVLFMCFYNGFQVKSAIIAVLLPFLLGDLVKAILSVGIGLAIKKTISGVDCSH